MYPTYWYCWHPWNYTCSCQASWCSIKAHSVALVRFADHFSCSKGVTKDFHLCWINLRSSSWEDSMKSAMKEASILWANSFVFSLYPEFQPSITFVGLCWMTLISSSSPNPTCYSRSNHLSVAAPWKYQLWCVVKNFVLKQPTLPSAVSLWASSVWSIGSHCDLSEYRHLSSQPSVSFSPPACPPFSPSDQVDRA